MCPTPTIVTAVPSATAASGARAAHPFPTPARIPLKFLSQVSGVRRGDRVLVIGAITSEALTGLAAAGVATLTVLQPNRPYPCCEHADLVWVVGVADAAAAAARLRLACRCLAPGGRLLIELCTPNAAMDASDMAVRLSRQGLEIVRVEMLTPATVLVRGCAPLQQRRAA